MGLNNGLERRLGANKALNTMHGIYSGLYDVFGIFANKHIKKELKDSKNAMQGCNRRSIEYGAGWMGGSVLATFIITTITYSCIDLTYKFATM